MPVLLSTLQSPHLAQPRGSSASGAPLTLASSNVNAYRIEDASNNQLFRLSTSTSPHAIEFGNATTNPDVAFLGLGKLKAATRYLQLGTGNALSAFDAGFFHFRAASDWRGVFWDESDDLFAFGQSTSEPAAANITIAQYEGFRAASSIIDGVLSFTERGSDPANVTDRGQLYVKDVSGASEFFVRLDGSTLFQVTKGGGLNAARLVIGSQAGGDILYFNGTDWVRLPKGTAGQHLVMNAGATAPEWA